MDLRKFSQINRVRCESSLGFKHPLQNWSLSDWICALTGEVGEAANVVKKLNRIRDGVPGNNGETYESLQESLRDELADTFIYLDLVAQAANIDLPTAVIDKFNQTSERIDCPIVLPEEFNCQRTQSETPELKLSDLERETLKNLVDAYIGEQKLIESDLHRRYFEGSVNTPYYLAALNKQQITNKSLLSLLNKIGVDPNDLNEKEETGDRG